MTKEEQIKGLIGGSWFKVIGSEFNKPYFDTINNTLASTTYYPEKHNIFRAFMSTSFDEVKIVILGLEPYHDGQATGLAFSSKSEMNPTLEAIWEGLNDDIAFGDFLGHSNNLTYLTNRGVLLMNEALTVLPGKPKSHSEMWKRWTESVFRALNKKTTPVIFLLWGKEAQYYKAFLDPFKHSIIECDYPSNKAWDHRECFSQAVSFVRERYGEHYSIW